MNLLLFSLCWMLPVDSMLIRLSSIFKRADQSIELNMAELSVDDMYEGCREMMADMVQETFFIKENTGLFENVWNYAENCANNKVRAPEDQALTKNHMQAICAYTANYKMFYETFNDAVRTSRSKYGSDFPFHSLHFWLTSAVQILNHNKKCQITYRRTNLEFNGSINQIIRFGNFASSSKLTTLTQFGKETCFIIKTCSGADLKHYPALRQYEEEVLIPPYEMFMITNNNETMDDCKIVYTLESVGVHSNLNCKAVK